MTLANEPFNLRPWEIARLTRHQVATLYLCNRDANGRPIVEPKFRPSRDHAADMRFVHKIKPWMTREPT